MERENPEVVTYTLRADWDEQSGAEITSRGITIKVDLPPEFGGLGRHLSGVETVCAAGQEVCSKLSTPLYQQRLLKCASTPY